jgi:hypothetical protein
VARSLNRAVARLLLFPTEADFEAFESVSEEARRRAPLDVLGDCLILNRGHFVQRPKRIGS